MEKRDIVIDADHIIYLLASPLPASQKRTLKGKSIVPPTHDIKRLKKAFKEHIRDYEKIAQVESIAHSWTTGKTKVVISDESNFRYDIFPEYKANRTGREHTEEFIKLRKWARKKYAPKQNVEADDVVAYYVSKGAIGFSTDKDLLRGVAGIWFDCYHGRKLWRYTTDAEANRFNFIQYVGGDRDDNIQGIKGVAEKTAITLLDEHGWTWEGVKSIYHSKGYTTEDAILTRRLVSMKQWTPKKGVKLFKDK